MEKGTVVKCNFCAEIIDDGLKRGLVPGVDREATPACVIACPTKTRVFGDLDNPESNISLLVREKRATPFHEQHGTDPSIYYILR